MRRSRWRSVLTLGDRDDVTAPDAPSVTDIDLRQALASLPDRDRLLVLLHFYAAFVPEPGDLDLAVAVVDCWPVKPVAVATLRGYACIAISPGEQG